MATHGLLRDAPPRLLETLEKWCDRHGVKRSRGLEVRVGADGWSVFAKRDFELGQPLCQVPKTSILSMRTSSLPPLLPEEHLRPGASHSILYLALALLHELRLGEASIFWGYTQSLPRETILLPAFWEMDDLAGEDGRIALEMLAGTEAERDILLKNSEGLSLDDVRLFYHTLSPHLPPTPAHPDPSPLSAYIHAYSLICTRAFLIDLYHTVGLCPFADLFNHSSTDAHTSLSSDDFVCHMCGSLKECPHDIPSTSGIVMRLEHLPDSERRRIMVEEDTVDLKVDRCPIDAGEEVFNSYGDGMGDARLLAEWGFIEDDSTGGSITFVPEELGSGLEGWEQMMEDGPLDVEISEYEDPLLGRPPRERYWSMDLDAEGALSVNVLAILALGITDEPGVETIRMIVSELEAAWSTIDTAKPTALGSTAETVVRRVLALLQTRLDALYRPDLAIEDLYDLRDAAADGRPLQRMALTVLVNERSLLESTRDKWAELLSPTA